MSETLSVPPFEPVADDAGVRVPARRRSVRRSLLPGVAALGLATAALAGCGGDDTSGSIRTFTSTTPTPQSSGTTAKGTSTAVGSAPAKNQATPKADRAATLKTSLVDGTAVGKKKNRFFVSSVKVDGGAIVVRTSGYPSGGAAAAGRGACAWIAGAETWMKTISVTGADGQQLASWKAGDQSCSSASGS